MLIFVLNFIHLLSFIVSMNVIHGYITLSVIIMKSHIIFNFTLVF